MSIVLDLIGSTVLGAFVLLLGLRLNMTVAGSTEAARADLNVQESLVDIVQTVEYDFRKIGYNVADATESIVYADTNRIRFLADMDNNSATALDTVEWWVGPKITTMANPNIRALYRRVSSAGAAVSAPGLGVTQFGLVFRDVDGQIVWGPSGARYPVPTADLPRIWIIETTLNVESPYKVADEILGYNKMVNSSAFWRQTRLASRNIKRHG